MDKLPIYRFYVPEEDDETGVSAIALVDFPAIEMDWQAFKSQFVIEPKAGETQDEFMGRCIPYEIGNGYEQDQAAAMCYAKWDKKEFAEGVPHYTKDGKLYEGPTHKDASGRLMTGATHTIDSEYLYHEDELKSLSLKFTSDVEKRIISGPLMVSNLPIFRKDESGEYYGVFTSEDIYNIVKKFFRNNNTAQVNMMHDSNAMVKGVYMIESFIIDSKRGIYSPAGYNLTEGSWFGSFKVDNDDVWENYIKSGEFKGFSVEGLFKTIKMTDKPKSIIDEIIDVVKNVDPSKVKAAMQILKKANI